MGKRVIIFLALIPVVLLVMGGMTSLHPLADSLAVFRLPLGVLTILSAAVLWPLWPRKFGMMLLALGVASSVTVGLSLAAPEPVAQPNYVLYQKNLSFRNTDMQPLAVDIANRHADFITLQEVTTGNKVLLSLLKNSHPSQLFCKFASVGGVGVVSRLPLIEGSQHCIEEHGLAAMQVATPDGHVWLVSLHLRWPFPYGQAAQVQALLPVLASFSGPVFVGGDFNMVPWSKSVTVIEQATRSKRIGHSNGTFRLKGLFNMPIDHVLVPRQFSGSVESLELLGSDHHGVEARIVRIP